MAVYSIVNLSQLEGAKRMDAEYYKPEYLEIREKLMSVKFVYFKELVKEIIHPKEIKREYEEEKKDYLFLLAQNVRPLMLDLSEKRYISEEKAKFMVRNILEKGDILLIRTGAVGDVAVYNGKPSKVVASAHILVCKPNFKLAPSHLGVFFNTSYGRSNIIKGTYGALQPEIAPNYLKTLPIPIFSEDFIKKIESLFITSQDLLSTSYTLYTQAENLLLEELGLKDYKPAYKKTYTAWLSDCFSAKRIDTEYFQPAYEEMMERVRNYKNGFGKLLDYIENVKPDFDPVKFPNKTFRYVELADIDSSIGIIQNTNEIKGENAPSIAKRVLKENDIIVSSVEGSLEKVALAGKEYEGCLASTGFFQFRPIKILPEALLILSKTLILQTQLKRKCAGTILTAVPKKAIKRLIIPLLPLPIQQQIADLVRKSHEARKKAKELLEVAKKAKAVEIAIENNEQEALRFMASSHQIQ